MWKTCSIDDSKRISGRGSLATALSNCLTVRFGSGTASHGGDLKDGFQPEADLEIPISIINIFWLGWRCDGAIQTRSLLNLLRVAVHNQISQIVKNYIATRRCEMGTKFVPKFCTCAEDRRVIT